MASAAESVHPPANAESRPNNLLSFSESNAWLQSIVALSVMWWAIVVLLPPVSSSKDSASLFEICSTESTLVLNAASSIAKGIPSRRWQICATAVAFSSVSEKSCLAALARSANRRVAS